ncbi:MAG: carbohydrate-binding protein, partial [Jiangellaceae bacterium]
MKVRTPLMTAALVLLTMGATLAAPPWAQASTTDSAFNAGTGALNVNYASYLSRHDVVYNSPNTDPIKGLTVGNGRTGAMAWQQNGLTMQVSGVDLAQQSTYAAGNVNLFSNPQLSTGYTTFQQRLSLYDGTLTTRYDNNRTVTVMGSPNSEVMGIHVEDTRPGVTSVGLDLSLWDLNTVQNIADVPNLDTWRQASTYADTTG